ncbi:MAG: hypothetical protein RIS50_1026 [Bacteroidota bacterium]
MAKREKKRLTAFAIIGMVTLVVVVGLWLGQNKQRSSTEPKTQIDSSQDCELLV